MKANNFFSLNLAKSLIPGVILTIQQMTYFEEQILRFIGVIIIIGAGLRVLIRAGVFKRQPPPSVNMAGGSREFHGQELKVQLTQLAAQESSQHTDPRIAVLRDQALRLALKKDLSNDLTRLQVKWLISQIQEFERGDLSIDDYVTLLEQYTHPDEGIKPRTTVKQRYSSLSGVGRTCKLCLKPLTFNQKDYCSFTCQNADKWVYGLAASLLMILLGFLSPFPFGIFALGGVIALPFVIWGAYSEGKLRDNRRLKS